MQAPFSVDSNRGPSIPPLLATEKKQDGIDLDTFCIELFAAAQKNDLLELPKLLKTAEQHPDKVPSIYLGEAMLQMCKDSHFDGLQLILHSSRANEIESRYFEEAATTASKSYEIKALKAIISSGRAKDISPSVLTFALRKTAETGQCHSEVIRKILALDNAEKIEPSEIGSALRDARRYDYLSVTNIVRSPIGKKIPKDDIAEVFCLALYQFGERLYHGDYALALWQTATEEPACDYLFNKALDYHRGHGKELRKLVSIAINKISIGCLEKAVNFLIEDERAEALKFILQSRRASEIKPECYEEALKTSCVCFQFEGMSTLVSSGIAQCFSAYGLYRALSFLAIPKSISKVSQGTAYTITTKILQLPEAQKLTCQQLKKIYCDAIRPGEEIAFRSESEEIVNALLDSSLWAKLHP